MGLASQKARRVIVAVPFELILQEEIYSLDIVQRAAHALSDRLVSRIERRDGMLVVRVSPLSDLLADGVDALFYSRLIDESLRVRIADETRELRIAVLQLAFGSSLGRTL